MYSMKPPIYIAISIAPRQLSSYSCVRRTVEQDLPREINYLRRHDVAIRRIMDVVECRNQLLKPDPIHPAEQRYFVQKAPGQQQPKDSQG